MPTPDVDVDAPRARALRLRWIVNSTAWKPSEVEFEFILQSLLPPHESDAVRRFRRMEDRKRAVLSRLMQRNAIARACEANGGGGAEEEAAATTTRALRGLDVRRTKGSKPFFAVRLGLAHAPNFNFNVSHEGDYVVLASETHAVVGVDVAAPGQVRRVTEAASAETDVEALLETFKNVLTQREVDAIRETAREKGERAGEELFRKHWSLKEAHVKAVGVGLGMDLKRCEFVIDDVSSTARVIVDGTPRSDWSFHMQAFPPIVQDAVPRENRHWITVSRGPLADVVDANGEFTSVVFSQRNFTNDEWSSVLNAVSPPWELLTVGDLIPLDGRDAYEEAGGVLY